MVQKLYESSFLAQLPPALFYFKIKDKIYGEMINMNQIKFSHDWNNKLSADIFTTIRRWTPEKEKYYHSSISERFNALLNGNKKSETVLEDVRVIRYCDIDINLLRLDTGIFDSMDIFKVFSKFGLRDIAEKMLILTFVKRDS